MIAASLLDANTETLTQPGKLHGEAEGGRYHWQLEITPWQDPQRRDRNQPISPGAARLLHVQLDLSWGDAGPRQRLRVSSLRLSLPSAAGSVR